MVYNPCLFPKETNCITKTEITNYTFRLIGVLYAIIILITKYGKEFARN